MSDPGGRVFVVPGARSRVAHASVPGVHVRVILPGAVVRKMRRLSDAFSGPLFHGFECSKCAPGSAGDTGLVAMAELNQKRTPEVVKTWLSSMPALLHLQAPREGTHLLPEAVLGAGERERLHSPAELPADAGPIDDRDARQMTRVHGQFAIRIEQSRRSEIHHAEALARVKASRPSGGASRP